MTSERRSRVLMVTPVRVPLVILGIALLYGTVGFMVIESFNLIDAVYMTVTTLTTVGFGEIHPLSPEGRIFTVTLIAIGFHRGVRAGCGPYHPARER